MSQGSQQAFPFARPAWLEGFHSDDLDEVRTYTRRWDGEHSRVAHGSGPLGYESAVLTGGVSPVAWGSVALPLTIRGALPHAVMHFGAVGRYRIGRREFVPKPHEAMFVSGGVEFTRHGQQGSMVAIAPVTARLLEEISARGAGRPGRLILSTRKLTITQAAHLRLATALGRFVSDRAPGGDPQRARRGEAEIIESIADILLEGSAVIPTREATNARIVGLEDWIEAHLDLPITAGQLCRVAGVSLRGLEKLFEIRRGMSPMRFVTERRLAAAHRRLVRAGPTDSVTTIASGVGFSHMGRFSSAYRQAFGESPSASLGRTQRKRT